MKTRREFKLVVEADDDLLDAQVHHILLVVLPRLEVSARIVKPELQFLHDPYGTGPAPHEEIQISPTPKKPPDDKPKPTGWLPRWLAAWMP